MCKREDSTAATSSAVALSSLVDIKMRTQRWQLEVEQTRHTL